MATQIESSGALERRLSLSVSMTEVAAKTSGKLREMARTVRMPGFRPGKVPLRLVEQSYGPKVHAEVLGDQVMQVFEATVKEQGLKVVGQPAIEPAMAGGGVEAGFIATFEVFPEVVLGDPGKLKIERVQCSVLETDVDRTLEILRRQNITWQLPPDEVSHRTASGQRVTLDFRGTLEGVAFPGGQAEGFSFVLGEGRMLPDFEAGMTGLAVGANHRFSMTFPSDYGASDLAGKAVEFDVTIKSIELPQLPELDEAFVKRLGVEDGTVEALRKEIRANLEREVARRVDQKLRTVVMDEILALSDFEVPKVLVRREAARMAEEMQKMFDKSRRPAPPIPAETFEQGAHKRVRLGLLLSEIVRAHGLQAKPDQVRKRVEEWAAQFDQPGEAMRQCLTNRDQLANIEAWVAEKNLIDWVLAHAQVTDREIGFQEIMADDSASEGASE